MKKIVFSLSTLLFLGVIVACSSSTKPEDVAKIFTESMAKQDYKTAKKHATKSSQQLIEMTESLMGGLGGGDLTKTDFKFKKVKDSVVSDSKTVITYLNTEGEEEDLTLVKEDGKWLVDMGGK